MTIQQLTLNSFRSIRNVQLNLGRVNVINGPNGCGKSNLYKAVRLIHEAASGRLTLALCMRKSRFGQLSDPHLYPELSQAREILRQWRFYHEFAVWPGSPLRVPQVGIRAPVLAHDGSNLAAAFRTIIEIGNGNLLCGILQRAFPDSKFEVQAPQGRFELLMHREGILRPLEAAELSDGTLRFLCLVVAMLSPRPPAFMALNEPENSLHPDLLPALAQLIAEASCYSQLWVTSHSPLLAGLIAEHCAVTHYPLSQQQGETVVEQQA